jgi:Zn-dependent peptidase ImmA (M78 family)
MRPRESRGVSRKLVPAIRQKLERELPTTRSSILARKYGVSKERIRQIRMECGAPSGREVQREWTAKARQQRREQKQLEQRRRREQRVARKLATIERFSERWKSGATLRELAEEYRTTRATIATRIQRLRKQYPEKFRYRRVW